MNTIHTKNDCFQLFQPQSNIHATFVIVLIQKSINKNKAESNAVYCPVLNIATI